MISRFSRPFMVRFVLAAFAVSNLAVVPRAEAAIAVTTADVTAIASAMTLFHSGAAAVTTSARWTSALTVLEANARSATAPGFLRSDGSWTDLNYTEVPTGAWSPWEHFRRITTMVKAYVTPGHSLHRSASLRQSIDSALTYSLTFYSATSPTPGNWWFWRIGVPLDLAPALVLMRDDLPATTVDQCTRALRAKMGPSSFYYPTANLLKGQNLVWSALNHLSLAILMNDKAMMADVRDAMIAATAVSSGDGLKADSSFHQHGPQLYTGAYGGAFANDVSKYLLLTRGTTLQLPDTRLQLFADYMADGVAWSLYQKHWDVSVVGREVARPSTTGHHGIASLLQMIEGSGPRRSEISATGAQMLRSWDWTLPTELAAIASRVEGRTIAAAWPSGNRSYRASDYVVHRRDNYFASIKMLSSRTESGEDTNGENILGSRQSDGRLNLVLRGDEYYDRDVLPTLDWSRLPGITVEQKPGAAGDTFDLGTRSFVGGTGDGQNGVAAMDFAAVGSTLTAKKGWIFFDDAIVFINSSIASLSGNPVETIIEQWPLSNVGAPLVVDGVTQPAANGWSRSMANPRWMHADRIGYYFPEPLTVKGKRELRSGSWSRLGAGSNSTREATNPILTLWIDHGTNVTNGSGIYAIVPDTTASQMQQWADASPLRILANDARVAAVRDARSGSVGMIFWQPYTLGGITTDSAALLFVTRDERRVRLSAADPRQGSGSMRIIFNESLALVSAPAGVTVTRENRSTVVSIPRNGGVTAQIELTSAPRQRAVRR